ncbi:hypothetical protein EV715DRAFT_214048 [Schizophyllum commune]
MKDLILPPTFTLPDLSLVREQAEQAQDDMRSARDPLSPDFADVPGGIMRVRHALYLAREFLHLFKFAVYCHIDDIPADLLPECIWACERFVDAVNMSTLEGVQVMTPDLLPTGSTDEAGKKIIGPDLRYLLVQNTRDKAIWMYLEPEVDKPVESIRLYNAMHKTNREVHKLSLEDHLAVPGALYAYATALARARTDDGEAKKLLLRAASPTSGLDVRYTAQCKAYLARVLRRLGEVEEAKKLEKWCINWFKKNPFGVDDRTLITMFTTDLDPRTDPVLLGLGGSKWLEGRKQTLKTQDRLGRLCRNCNKREPQVKLMQCSRCKHIYYCSRECQVANHKYHKDFCKDMANSMARAAELKASGKTEDARRAERWTEFQKLNGHPADTTLLVSALGLHRDLSRSRTHIVIRAVEHQPRAKHPFDYFRFTYVGVFKMEDVYPEIEGAMALRPGEGRQWIEEMLEEFDATQTRNKSFFPIFHLSFSPDPEHVRAWLAHGGMSKGALDTLPYDPHWRQKINRLGSPPQQIAPLFVRKGIQDAEHIF